MQVWVLLCSITVPLFTQLPAKQIPAAGLARDWSLITAVHLNPNKQQKRGLRQLKLFKIYSQNVSTILTSIVQLAFQNPASLGAQGYALYVIFWYPCFFALF